MGGLIMTENLREKCLHGRQDRFSKKDPVKVYGRGMVHSQDGYQISILVCENLMFNLICCSYPVIQTVNSLDSRRTMHY